MEETPKRDWSVFVSSIFFVLGFSLIFSIVGILLQTLLAHATLSAQMWFNRIGGVVIILFGLFLMDLFTPKFLTKAHPFAVKRKFKTHYLTSFVFGAAFALGWTPCVSAALGAILVLASTSPGSAFLLLFAYTLGIGIPFLLVGLFTNAAERLIARLGGALRYFQYVFGVLLLVIGVFIFTGELSRIANFQFLTNVLLSLNVGTSAGGNISSLNLINFSVAFIAGLASFLSPCILPIIPGFLSYLASTATTKSSQTIKNESTN